jgi:hypothetical protein
VPSDLQYAGREDRGVFRIVEVATADFVNEAEYGVAMLRFFVLNRNPLIPALVGKVFAPFQSLLAGY